MRCCGIGLTDIEELEQPKRTIAGSIPATSPPPQDQRKKREKMNDLRDIFDTFMEASTILHKQAKINDLKREINQPKRCGDCEYWMDRFNCPIEHGVGSQKGGPSMGHMKCSKFKESRFSIQHRESKQQELNQLLEEQANAR